MIHPDPNHILYPFAVDVSAGRFAEEADHARHVRQLMLQVLFTAPGERVNRPDFGCGIKRMVFAPNSDVSASLAQVQIYAALTKWLAPVISVKDIKVTAIDSTMEIRVAYLLKARGEMQYLNVEVTR